MFCRVECQRFGFSADDTVMKLLFCSALSGVFTSMFCFSADDTVIKLLFCSALSGVFTSISADDTVMKLLFCSALSGVFTSNVLVFLLMTQSLSYYFVLH